MGDHEITNPIKKWKKRAKRFACAGALLLLFGILCIVCGIALLVKFSDYWGMTDEEKLKSGVAYFGCAVLILGVVLLSVGIGIFITIYIVYKRFTRSLDGPQHHFKPPTFAPGKAPYPQQKPFIAPQGPAASPSAPQAPSGGVPGSPAKMMPQANPAEVNVEVTENYKF